MDEREFLADNFEANRARLRAVAYRMLGSRTEAEDAVQEAWLRLNRTEPDGIDNLAGWLTTVVARVCLDMLRTRKIRGEEPLEDPSTGQDVREQAPADVESPEREALLADSVGFALLVVLKTLTPAERVAFVLHDMFDLPFEEIAPILDRSPAAVRQLASRARRRVQGAPALPDDEPSQQRRVVEAFLAASRSGDLNGIISVLDPGVVFRADAAAAAMGGTAEMRGAADVAQTFKGRAQAARLALVDGAVGLTVALQGQLRIALGITIADGRIVAIDAIADPDHLRRLDIAPLYV
jgi:RNA polymerase sigma factor (sigma-70 family)